MIGKAVGGYRIIEQIGMGGMATVYKAYDASMDRYVALKTLPQQYLEDPEFRARFEREAHAIARLEHAHILPVFAYGEDDGVTYLAMRYMESGTLSDLIQQGPLALSDVAHFLTEIAAALDYAHSKGIIHRDVKPKNVLVDQQGDAYLTDFGIAKIIGSGVNLTATGMIVGTPQYMSPEQFESGEGQATPASDQYSLAVMVYEMVTGRTPYQAETPWAIIGMHQRREELPLPRAMRPELPPAAENALLKGLSHDPQMRYPSCTALAEVFGAAIAHAPIPSVQLPVNKGDPPTVIGTERLPDKRTTIMQPPLTARRHGGLGWLILALVIAALGIGAILFVTRAAPQPSSAVSAGDVTRSPTALVPSATERSVATPSPTAPGLQSLRAGLPIREGPGDSYPVLQLLNAGDSIVIMGISEDGLWYQVRMTDGRLGWVVGSASSVTVLGDLRSVPVALAPTMTLTPTPTVTLTPTPTVTLTPTPTVTLTPTPTVTLTPTPTVTLMPTPTVTLTPTPTMTLTPTPTVRLTATPTTRDTPQPTEIALNLAIPQAVRQGLVKPEIGDLVTACPDGDVCVEAINGVVSVLPSGLRGSQIIVGGWSHDGQRIAFVEFVETPPNQRLHILERDTEQVRTVLLPRENIASPVWSPDDTVIAAHANCSLVLIDVPESDEMAALTPLARAAFHDDTMECYYNPQWSPDGSQLVVAWTSTNMQFPMNFEVRVVNMEQRRLVTVFSAPLYAPPSCNLFQQAFSPDGEWVAFYNTACQPILGRADGSGLTFAPLGQFPYWWTGQFMPQWGGLATALPAPVQAALVAPTSGEMIMHCPGTGMCISNVGGSTSAIPMTTDWAQNTIGSGGWSPDGQQIVFSLSVPGVNNGVSLINRDGSALFELPIDGLNVMDTTWSPDGRMIAAHASCSLVMLTVPEPEGTPQLTILRRNENGDCYIAPQWSPESNRVVTTWVNTQFTYPLRYEVRVVEVPTGLSTTVYQAELREQQPCMFTQAFSPDGEWVAFYDATCQTVIARADGTSTAPLPIEQFPYWWTGQFTPQWGDGD